MSSLCTTSIPLHKFKYVGNSNIALVHEFKYYFEAFIQKNRNQIFLNDIEIQSISKEYNDFYMSKIKEISNIESRKKITRETDFEIIKRIGSLKSGGDKAIIVINKKAYNNKYLYDFDMKIKHINVSKNILLEKIVGAIISKNKKSLLLLNFDKDVEFINNLKCLKYLKTIPTVVSTKANFNRRILLKDINIECRLLHTNVKVKKMLDSSQVPRLMNVRKIYRNLLYDEIYEIIKNVNNEAMLDSFISSRVIKKDILFFEKFQAMNEIDKFDTLKKYLNLSFNYAIKDKMDRKYFIKDNISLYKYTCKFNYLTKGINDIYKYKVLNKYTDKFYNNNYKAIINKKYMNKSMKDFNKIINKNYYLSKAFKDIYSINIKKKSLSKAFKDMNVRFIDKRMLKKSYGNLIKMHYKPSFLTKIYKNAIMLKNDFMYLNKVNKDIYKFKTSFKLLQDLYRDIKMHYNTRKYGSRIFTNAYEVNKGRRLNKVKKEIYKLKFSFLKKTFTQINLLHKIIMAKKKEKPNLWKVSGSSKKLKKEKIEVIKISRIKFIDKFVVKMLKIKQFKFYSNVVKDINKKFSNKFIVKTYENIIRLKTNKLLSKNHKQLEQIIVNKLMSLTKKELLKSQNKYCYLNKTIDILVHNKFRFKGLNKTSSEILYNQFKFKGLNKTWTDIYIFKPVIKFLEIKRKWWILEHNGITDKLIIPNIDYPYEVEPVIGIKNHPISVVKDINYEDINYGTKEIEVSIKIMQQMLNILFSIWNGALNDFSEMSTREAIEKVMTLFYTWINIPKVKSLMIEKGSREDYLRIYRWFRWEAEKVWIEEKDDNDNTGVKSIGMLTANIIEYMKNHHYNIVPITNKDRLIQMDNMLTAFQIELWDYFKKPDKTKGKRKYMISTVVRHKIKKKLILKI